MKGKKDWLVGFDTFLTHIRHDIKKGIDNQHYTWQNIDIKTEQHISVFQNKYYMNEHTMNGLGTEEKHSKDNWIYKDLDFTNLNNHARIQQRPIDNTVTNEKEVKPVNTNKVIQNATSTIKTVAQEIQASALTSAKMEAGENILLALRNITMQRAGFMQKVKFKFAPIALDTAVTVGADILVAELLPNNKSAKLAVECLNLAMTKEVIHALPIKEFTNALTGGEALAQVKTLVGGDE